VDSVTSDWENLSLDERMRYVMGRLVDRYEYPVNGAAGIVGNLSSESGVLPNRIEGSKAATPLRTQDFHGNSFDFTPEQVMNRDKAAKRGPKLPGIGLAQWTSKGRRAGLFSHVYEGKSGPGVLFDMDAQIDYLDSELRNSFASVRGVVSSPSVTVNDASDEVLYNFETPSAILDSNRKKLPRSNGNVQAVFKARRTASNRALLAYSSESGGDDMRLEEEDGMAANILIRERVKATGQPAHAIWEYLPHAGRKRCVTLTATMLRETQKLFTERGWPAAVKEVATGDMPIYGLVDGPVPQRAGGDAYDGWGCQKA
jgi:hypothetical protein